MQKTFVAKPAELKRDWFVIDVQDMVLGRAATEIATILRGKHKPVFTPHADTGDYVIVVNADKVRLTGNKWTDKMYHYHTNYIGGIKSANAKTVHARHPTQLVEDAVRGMLRRSPLGRQMMRKLKVYAGTDHPHTAQQPKPYKLAS